MSDEPPIRVMALHALAYCQRLFYLEEVEEIRVADAAVYAGRELHSALEAEEGETWCSVQAESSELGLTGKIDCLRRRNGTMIPYEHKRGRPRREDGRADAWPSDRIQATAYALLLEDAVGEPVPEARVHYHAGNVTVRIPVDDEARQEVVAAITEARRLRASLERPPITDNERLCVRCSLAPVCLPEEVRHQRLPEHKPIRLFPAADDRATLHILTPGSRVGRSIDTLVVKSRDEQGQVQELRHPVRQVAAVVLHGFAQISSQALRLCVDREVGVHWLTGGGRYIAGLTPGVGPTQRRVRQYRALTDSAVCLRLAKALVHARIAGQRRYLLRATRGSQDRRGQVRSALVALSQALASIAGAKDADVLRGHEGEAATHYLGSLNALLSSDLPESLRYARRTRRPPRDRFNALLSYGYSLLYAAVARAVLAVGLEPALGFYHRPRSAAHPLVLDLMELFRVPLWDLVLVGSLNRGQWDPDADFAATRAKVWLSDAGRRKAIGLFEDRLQDRWKHPVLDYSLSYARTIELEARLLEKEWTGEPGLFARSRLR